MENVRKFTRNSSLKWPYYSKNLMDTKDSQFEWTRRFAKSLHKRRRKRSKNKTKRKRKSSNKRCPWKCLVWIEECILHKRQSLPIYGIPLNGRITQYFSLLLLLLQFNNTQLWWLENLCVVRAMHRYQFFISPFYPLRVKMRLAKSDLHQYNDFTFSALCNKWDALFWFNFFLNYLHIPCETRIRIASLFGWYNWIFGCHSDIFAASLLLQLSMINVFCINIIIHVSLPILEKNIEKYHGQLVDIGSRDYNTQHTTHTKHKPNCKCYMLALHGIFFLQVWRIPKYGR